LARTAGKSISIGNEVPLPERNGGWGAHGRRRQRQSAPGTSLAMARSVRRWRGPTRPNSRYPSSSISKKVRTPPSGRSAEQRQARRVRIVPAGRDPRSSHGAVSQLWLRAGTRRIETTVAAHAVPSWFFRSVAGAWRVLPVQAISVTWYAASRGRRVHKAGYADRRKAIDRRLRKPLFYPAELRAWPDH